MLATLPFLARDGLLIDQILQLLVRMTALLLLLQFALFVAEYRWKVLLIHRDVAKGRLSSRQKSRA